MPAYYLQRANEQFWDAVDEFTYKNWSKAVRDDDSQQYNGNGVLVSETGVICRTVVPFTANDIAHIARFTGAGREVLTPNYTMPGGIVREPVYVKMKMRTKTVLRDIKNAKSFKG